MRNFLLKKIYKFPFRHILIDVYFSSQFKKNNIENKNIIFQLNYARYEKKLDYKIVCLKEVYKFLSTHFLISCIFFVLIQRNTNGNQKSYFFL